MEEKGVKSEEDGGSGVMESEMLEEKGADIEEDEDKDNDDDNDDDNDEDEDGDKDEDKDYDNDDDNDTYATQQPTRQ